MPPRLDASRRFLLGLGAALALGGCAAPNRVPNGRIAPFSEAPAIDTLPPGWEPYVLRRDLPRTEYRVAALQGRRVLYGGGTGVSSGLRCAVTADPAGTPWLRWQWRTDQVPDGMQVGGRDVDDSPARVIVAFDGDHRRLSDKDRAFYELVHLLTGERLPYATLMYVWDGLLPTGSLATYARTGRIRYLVVESGAARTGHWLAYQRDLRADFQFAFGEAPGPVNQRRRAHRQRRPAGGRRQLVWGHQPVAGLKLAAAA
jgi:hypothetical protein